MRYLPGAAALILFSNVLLAQEGIRSPQALVAAAKAEVEEITPAQLASRRADVVLIDVREPDEFAAGHIDDAVNYPRGVLEFRVQTHPTLVAIAAAAPAKLADAEIVLYCRSGARSALAALSLKALGFTRVASLAGGYRAWQAAEQE